MKYKWVIGFGLTVLLLVCGRLVTINHPHIWSRSIERYPPCIGLDKEGLWLWRVVFLFFWCLFTYNYKVGSSRLELSLIMTWEDYYSIKPTQGSNRWTSQRCSSLQQPSWTWLRHGIFHSPLSKLTNYRQLFYSLLFIFIGRCTW